MNPPDSNLPGAHGPAVFVTTHWSLVLAAGGDSPAASAALEELCRTYWYPLYAYVRRKGHEVHDAQDLTQEFFARLLRGNSLAGVQPEKGKFRSFLLAAMNHFLAKEWRRETAQKRGGGQVVFSFDAADAEHRYQLEPVDTRTPERIYERRWAMTLLARVFERLRQERHEAGQGERFDALQGLLTGEKAAQPYAQIARRLGLTEAAVKQDAARLKQRYGQLLRLEVAQTVNRPDEVDAELRHLFAALRP